MIKRFPVILTLLLLLPTNVSPVQVHGQTTELLPTSVQIGGSIVDNFANITHTYEFDNSVSAQDTLVDYWVRAPAGLLLSNASVAMNDLRFWGRVSAINTAQQIFNDSVAANKSAVLITSFGDQYRFEINVEANAMMELTTYFEGYLTRNLGVYQAEIYNPNTLQGRTIDLSVDITLISTGSDIISARPNLTNYQRLPIPGGKAITFSDSTFTMNSPIYIDYTLSQLTAGGKLLTYSNGTDNFFMYMLAPEIQTETERQPREFIFVIDVSGSMSGQRISQAKAAFAAMIETLTPDDMFNVISFQATINQVFTNSQIANTANVDWAVDWVNALDSGGSTNINGAMMTALDSFVGEFSAKVVTLLSDGAPTSGTTVDSSQIRQNIISANVAEAAIFTVAFGSGADISLMEGIAYDNGGEYVLIVPGSNAIEELATFYESFATPVALGFLIQYNNVRDVYPLGSSLPSVLFNGSEVVQTGRYFGELQITTTISFSDGDQVFSTSENTINTDNKHIERIWALNSITQLLKIDRASELTSELKQLVTNIAVYYGLVVEGYTGMTIVVEEVQDEAERDPPATETQSDGFADVGAAVPPVAQVTTTATSAPAVKETVNTQDADSDDQASLNGFPLILGTFAIFAFAFMRRKYRESILNIYL